MHAQAIRREGFRKRRAALGLPPGDTDPYFDTMDDSEWQVSRVYHRCSLLCRCSMVCLSGGGSGSHDISLACLEQLPQLTCTVHYFLQHASKTVCGLCTCKQAWHCKPLVCGHHHVVEMPHLIADSFRMAMQPEEEPEELIAARNKLNSASLTQQENEPAGKPVCQKLCV